MRPRRAGRLRGRRAEEDVDPCTDDDTHTASSNFCQAEDTAERRRSVERRGGLMAGGHSADDEYGGRRTVQGTSSHASEQNASESPRATRSNDQQIALASLHDIEQL
jgi:hypothetical protein